MPTAKQVEETELRLKVTKAFGDRCVLCAAGPLKRRALHLYCVPTAVTGYVPMCKACKEGSTGQSPAKYMKSRVRHNAKVYDLSAQVLFECYPHNGVPSAKGIGG